MIRPVRAVKDKALTTLILLTAVAGMKLFDVSCPFYAITAIPCPTCGMTRAWLSVLRLDFAAAFAYHPLFWTIPLLYVCYLYDGRLFPKRWQNAVFYTLIGAAYPFCWIIRLFL